MHWKIEIENQNNIILVIIAPSTQDQMIGNQTEAEAIIGHMDIEDTKNAPIQHMITTMDMHMDIRIWRHMKLRMGNQFALDANNLGT